MYFSRSVCCQVIFLYLIGFSVADKLDRTYLPPSNAGTAGGNQLLSTPYQGNAGSLSQFHQPNSVNSNYGFNGGHGFASPNKDKFTSSFGGTNVQQPNSVYSNNGFNGGHVSNGFGSPNKDKFPSSFGGTKVQVSQIQQPNPVYTNNGFNGGHASNAFGSPNRDKFPANFGGTNVGLNKVNARIRPSSSYLPPSTSLQHAPNQNRYGGNDFTSANSQSFPSKYNGQTGFVNPSNSHGGFAPSPSSSYPPSNILRYNNQNNGDGRYQFNFETENKISQSEAGEIQNAGTDRESSVVHGDYSYVAPDGRTIAVKYIADENGFRPSGDHIPFTPSSQSAGYPQSSTNNQQSNTRKEYQAAVNNNFAQFGSNKGYPSTGGNAFTSSYKHIHDNQPKPFTNHVGFDNGRNQNFVGNNRNSYGTSRDVGQKFQAFDNRSGFKHMGSHAGSQVNRKYLPPS